MSLTGNEEVLAFSSSGQLAVADKRITTQAIADGALGEVPALGESGPLAALDKRVSMADLAAGTALYDVPLFDVNGVLAAPSIIKRATAAEIAVLAGGGSYHASAVRFDNTTPDAVNLHIASLSVTDSPLFSQVFWIKTSQPSDITSPVFWVSDPTGNYYDTSSLSAGSVQVNQASGDGLNAMLFQSSVNIADGAWHSVIIGVDYNHASGSRPAKVYVDKVDVTEILSGSGSAFMPALNGFPFYVGDDTFGSGLIADIADFRIMVGTSLLTAGDISPSTLGLFTDENNKPVDPAVATTELGQPTILFSGNDLTFGDNKGTGGAFTKTGAFTNSNSSPSD